MLNRDDSVLMYEGQSCHGKPQVHDNYLCGACDGIIFEGASGTCCQGWHERLASAAIIKS